MLDKACRAWSNRTQPSISVVNDPTYSFILGSLETFEKINVKMLTPTLTVCYTQQNCPKDFNEENDDFLTMSLQ